MSFHSKIGKLAGTILASASALVLLGVSPVYALNGTDLVSAGSVWLETTIAIALVFVTAMAFSLQIARGYFLRTLEKFTLRLGADIWWLAYVLIRDGLIFMSFIMGLLVVFPGTFYDYPMAVPFMPLSVVLFGAALITKLYFDADEDRKVFRVVTTLVFLGTAMWIFGAIFVTETPLALSPLPSGVSPSNGIWAYVSNTFSSTNDVNLAMLTFYGTTAALGVLALLGFAHPMLHSRVGKGVVKAQQSVGPAAPTSFPTRSVDLARGPEPRRSGGVPGSAQASTGLNRDQVDYIQ